MSVGSVVAKEGTTWARLAWYVLLRDFLQPRPVRFPLGPIHWCRVPVVCECPVDDPGISARKKGIRGRGVQEEDESKD